MNFSRGFVASLLILALNAGCQSPDSLPPPSAASTSLHFQLNVENLRTLPSDEQYVIWFKYASDSVWSSPTPLKFYFLGARGGPDSLKFTATATLDRVGMAIDKILLSIEPTSIDSSRPAAPLASGNFVASDSSCVLSPTNEPGVGDFSSLEGNVTFATTSSDTNRARSEYYLMRLDNGSPVAGLDSLPDAPTGWRYGLWMTDSNYFPMHQFYYGSFVRASGFDSDHSRDAFPFPGGFKSAVLTDPGGRLRVTLEPAFANDPPTTPSRIVLLELRLRKMLHDNETLPMTNTWSASAPHGLLSVVH